MIDAKEAARQLGISRQRVLQLIEEKCPECGGNGCSRCHKTGRRLPAMKRCCGVRSKFMIEKRDLELVRERTAGRPRKDKE